MNHITRLLSHVLDRKIPLGPDERVPGEKTVAERKAREAFYSAVYDPANFRPTTPSGTSA